jgi:ADP-heptose:LPS heptosyltransferase
MTGIFIKMRMIAIAILAAFAAIIRGGVRRVIKEPRRIIVVQNAKLGDMVCTTPVFRAIKKTYPDAYLAVLGNAINKSLLDGNTDIDEYIVFDGSFWSIVRMIRAGRFDVGILTTPDALGLSLLYLGGARAIAAPRVVGGYSPQETRLYKFLRIFAHIVPHHMSSYAPREYLRLLTPFGINVHDTTKHLAFSETADRQAIKFLADQGVVSGRDFLVGISPSAGNKIKEWPAERFAVVATHAIGRYHAKVVMIGNRADRELGDRVIAALPDECKKSLIDAVGYFDIDGLKALIAKLNIFIAVDTGPIYIAEAYDVPTIDIVGPVDENEQPPRGLLNEVVYLPDRVPQVHIMNARVYNEKEARRQVEEISVDMVTEKLDELMRKINMVDRRQEKR